MSSEVFWNNRNTLVHNDMFLLKEAPKSSLSPVALDDASDKTDESSERPYICISCAAPIASASAWMAVNGKRQHTFANPGGEVYTIGCFSDAGNLLFAGNPTGHFSWFPGYHWQVAVCAGCGLHLGWRYVAGNHFFGLIMDRLRVL